MRTVPHEITMIALAVDPDTGGRTVFDVIETSNHFASHFARKWVKSADVVAISTRRPVEGGRRFGPDIEWHTHEVRR